MLNQKKLSMNQSGDEVAFKINELMLLNMKGAFKTFDRSLISKYRAISNINFLRNKKV